MGACFSVVIVELGSGGCVGYIWKVGATGFPDYWTVRCKAKRCVEDDFKDFASSKWTMGLISAEVGKAVNGAVLVEEDDAISFGPVAFEMPLGQSTGNVEQAVR